MTLENFIAKIEVLVGRKLIDAEKRIATRFYAAGKMVGEAAAYIESKP